MRLEDKIYGSIGLTVFLTIAYYYVYSFIDLYMSKLCKKYVCFEFPPYADVLAVWVAIVGLYFVVTSLDAWKHQDQFNAAREIYKNIEETNDKLLNIQMLLCTHRQTHNYKDIDPKSDLAIDIKKIFKDEFKKSNIFELSNKTDLDLYTTITLFQDDLSKINKLLRRIIFGIYSDIESLELRSANDFEQIYIKHRNNISLMDNKLRVVNSKLKDYIQ